MIRISAISPVLNEVDFIGYCIMAALPYVHEFVYALDEQSDDGTRDLLHDIKNKYAHEKLVILEHPNFHPSDQKAYNESFNRCIKESTGNAAMFLHPDQIITSGPTEIQEGPMAWWVEMKSFAGDFNTVISKGRCDKWKNIHAKKFGLTYYGAYGSQNEDFYHREITGNSYKHYGTEFLKYPYPVADSGLSINHYCELKDYKRRLEKMNVCLKTLYPTFSDEHIEELAIQHPRVTLEESSRQFGQFKFEESQEQIPDVFKQYKDEFESYKTKEEVYG